MNGCVAYMLATIQQTMLSLILVQHLMESKVPELLRVLISQQQPSPAGYPQQHKV